MCECEIFLIVICYVIIIFIVLVCSTFLSSRNWWFGAHLTDILHHCGQIDSQTLAYVKLACVVMTF